MIDRLQDCLAVQAQLRPDAGAAVFREQRMCYGELERTSNRIARGLQAVGCLRGDRVALLLTKSPKTLATMFGVLKADGIYVPVDPASPSSRIGQILTHCGCRCVVADRSTASKLNELVLNGSIPLSTRILWLDQCVDLPPGIRAMFCWDHLETLSDRRVESRNSSSDAAHILYTSGSTGGPKGVVIKHSGVIRFIEWAIPYFGIGPGQRISCHPPLHFDLSTFDIYGTIAAGAEIHFVPPELNLLPHRLASFIEDAELTQWFSVPSALLPIAKLDVLGEDPFPALRRLLWCGERFPVPALVYWMRHLPRVAFYNLYGPTETTIASSCFHVAHCPQHPDAEIPIGSACDGESLMVLDSELNPTAPEVVGDLYIAGAGLSAGYWNDPVKTAEVFPKNPHTPNSSDLIYKTGDLARVGQDGMLYLVGRSDTQVKVRGFRIELGEIETALHAVAGVVDCVVVAVESPDSSMNEICCAYVSRDGVSPASIKNQITRTLPHYMVPTRWLVLDSMPHNGNGKADRRFVRDRFRQDGTAPEPDMISHDRNQPTSC